MHVFTNAGMEGATLPLLKGAGKGRGAGGGRNISMPRVEKAIGLDKYIGDGRRRTRWRRTRVTDLLGILGES